MKNSMLIVVFIILLWSTYSKKKKHSNEKQKQKRSIEEVGREFRFFDKARIINYNLTESFKDNPRLYEKSRHQGKNTKKSQKNRQSESQKAKSVENKHNYDAIDALKNIQQFKQVESEQSSKMSNLMQNVVSQDSIIDKQTQQDSKLVNNNNQIDSQPSKLNITTNKTEQQDLNLANNTNQIDNVLKNKTKSDIVQNIKEIEKDQLSLEPSDIVKQLSQYTQQKKVKKKMNIDQIGKKVYKRDDLVFDDQPQIYKSIVKSQQNKIERSNRFSQEKQSQLWNKTEELKYSDVKYPSDWNDSDSFDFGGVIYQNSLAPKEVKVQLSNKFKKQIDPYLMNYMMSLQNPLKAKMYQKQKETTFAIQDQYQNYTKPKKKYKK